MELCLSGPLPRYSLPPAALGPWKEGSKTMNPDPTFQARWVAGTSPSQPRQTAALTSLPPVTLTLTFTSLPGGWAVKPAPLHSE